MEMAVRLGAIVDALAVADAEAERDGEGIEAALSQHVLQVGDGFHAMINWGAVDQENDAVRQVAPLGAVKVR